MPKLKQPPPLLNMAMDVLINFYANYCHECSIEGSLDKLRLGVAFIKEDIGPYIPWQLAAEFYERFLREYLYEFRPRARRLESHERAVLEVIMDRKIIGLKCSDLRSMDLKDAHRIQGLRKLELNDLRRYNLETFHLKDLTALTYRKFCTDSDLEVIGKNCSKLEELDVAGSEEVTDEGLRALSLCSELCDVHIHRCPRVTHKGIQDLLSDHGKIQRLYAWSHSQEVGFDCFSNAGWSVYPSIKGFGIVLDVITERILRCIVEKFPNLTALTIDSDLYYSASLTTLGSLNELSELNFCREWGFRWDKLKPLLKMIGANITTLTTSCFIAACGTVTQNDLDFLYTFCPNTERFEFDYVAKADGEMLVIPPFKSLKQLRFNIPHPDSPYFLALQFGVMSKLERLTLYNFKMATEIIESMILDNTKFPNLKFLGLSEEPWDNDIDYITEIAKNNNLDFQITDEYGDKF